MNRDIEKIISNYNNWDIEKLSSRIKKMIVN